MKGTKETNREIRENKNYCIFENRICRWAKKEGPAFECKCPTDDQMPCRR